MSQFDRIANVKIFGSETDISDLEIQISKLRIEFAVKKTETPDSNSCTINIYNLSENTRNLIDRVDKIMILEAGYSESSGLETLFVGNISNITHSINKPNVITKVESNDGEKALQNARSALSYSGATSVKQMLKGVIRDFNIGEKVKLDLIPFTDKILNNGFNFIGSTKTIMDKLTKMVGLQWSIQNNEIKVYKEDETDNFTIINLTPDTGLIGSPEKINIKKSKKKGFADVNGWKVSSLLQPKIEPGGRITIESKNITGSLFKVLNVEHNGDTHGGGWQSNMEVVEV